MGLWLPSSYRNPLAYPAGVAPGFDPGHVAARNTRISVVSVGGNVINLFTGGTGTIAGGSPAGTLDANIGPATNFAKASADQITFSGLPTTKTHNYTFGVIFSQAAGNSGATKDIIAFGGQFGCEIYNHFNNISVVGNGGTWGTGTTLSNNYESYFMGLTIVGGTSKPGAIVFAPLSKQSPYQYAESAATGFDDQATATDGIFYVGKGPSSAIGGSIAAAMYADAYIGPTALKMWAADPWSFWYPPRRRYYVGASAAAAAAGGMGALISDKRSVLIRGGLVLS